MCVIYHRPIVSCLILMIVFVSNVKPDEPEKSVTPVASEATAASTKEAAKANAARSVQFIETFLAGDQSDINVIFARSLLASNQLGIEVIPADGTLTAQLNIENGIVITSAPEESEGAKAGLRVHDVLLSINRPRSEPMRDVSKFQELLTNNVGKTIELLVLRGGKPYLVQVAVPKPQELLLEDAAKAETRNAETQVEHFYRIGLSLAEADDTLRTHLGISPGHGLVVTDVIAGSAASKVGIKQNDVLVELDHQALTNAEAVTKQVQEIKERQVEVKLIRSGKELTVSVTPEKYTANKVDSQAKILLIDCPAFVNGVLLTQSPNGNVRVLDKKPVTATADVRSSDAGSEGYQSQVRALREQLAQVQKLVDQLEASMSAASQPPAATAEEKK